MNRSYRRVTNTNTFLKNKLNWGTTNIYVLCSTTFLSRKLSLAPSPPPRVVLDLTILDKINGKPWPPHPPNQRWENGAFLPFAWLHPWFGGDGDFLFHFILSKIVATLLPYPSCYKISGRSDSPFRVCGWNFTVWPFQQKTLLQTCCHMVLFVFQYVSKWNLEIVWKCWLWQFMEWEN